MEHSENYWTLIRLEENKTLVTNTTKYSEHIEPDILRKLSEEKINTFLTIENILKEKYDNKKNIDKDDKVEKNKIKDD